MEPVTIDKIGLETYRKWAEDQSLLDPTLLKESALVSPHPQVTGTTSIFASQFSTLFGLSLLHLPWAGFFPPLNFRAQGKRFFSHKIVPHLAFPFDENSEEKEEEGKERRKEALRAFLRAQKGKVKDQEVLIELIDTLFTLDDLLAQILAKKLQYHKG